MAVTEQVSRPAPFVEKLGTNLAENVLAQQGVPIVTCLLYTSPSPRD